LSLALSLSLSLSSSSLSFTLSLSLSLSLTLSVYLSLETLRRKGVVGGGRLGVVETVSLVSCSHANQKASLLRSQCIAFFKDHIARSEIGRFLPGLPDFSWYMIPKPEKCTKVT
jgi:hypothetical protein